MAPHRNNIYGVSSDTPSLSELEIHQIQPPSFQPRTIIPKDYIKELTESIRDNGQIDPIDVLAKKDEPGTYILIDGQCRLKALEALGRNAVLALVRQEGDPHKLALILNLQRRGFHPLDEATSMAILIKEYGYSQEDLAQIVSKPRATVAETLAINNLPDEVKEECRALDIGKTHLVELARLVDQPEEMRELFGRIRAGDRIGTRELKRRRLGRQAPARAADTPKALIPMIRVIETTHKVRDALQKIQPSSIIASHPERLVELKELHKEIGGLIKKLQRGGDKQAGKARGIKNTAGAEPDDIHEDETISLVENP